MFINFERVLLVHSTKRHKPPKIQSLSQKPMIRCFYAELPNMCISSAPAIIDVLDRVAQQSEWLSMIYVNSCPIRRWLSSLIRLPFPGIAGRKFTQKADTRLSASHQPWEMRSSWHSEIYSDFEDETEFIGDHVDGIIQLEDMTVSPALIIHFTESAHRWEEKIRFEIGTSVLIID
jgi:hypothetical protein